MKKERLIEPEMLDGTTDANAAGSLRDLRSINRWLGGHVVTRWTFRQLRRPNGGFTVLDVGAASGDNGRQIRSVWPDATVISVDLLRRNLEGADAPCLVADAFRLPVAERSVDFVFCSLFLHHFTDEAVVKLLEGFRRVARCGVVVNDLERHPFAHKSTPVFGWMFGWNAVTLHDAPVSVQAGFTATELRGLAERAGMSSARVRRHLPWFRLSMLWERAR